MSWLLSELTRRYPDLGPALDTVGVLDPHETHHAGRTYVTPALIDHDDGKEDTLTHGNHENPIP